MSIKKVQGNKSEYLEYALETDISTKISEPKIKKRGRPKKTVTLNQQEQTEISDSAKTKTDQEEIIEQSPKSLEEIFDVNDKSEIQTINQNCFKCNYVVDVKLKISELGPDIVNHVRNYIKTYYCNWETRGKMLIDFEFDQDFYFPLANNWMDYVSFKVPIVGTFKIFRIGNIIEGLLSFGKENEMYIKGKDILCYIYKEQGIISYKNDNICYKRDDKFYFTGQNVKVKIKNIETSTQVPLFICNGVLVTEN